MSSTANGLMLQVRCASHLEWIDPMQAVAEQVFSRLGFGSEEGYWPILAVREAVMNAVLHGNKQNADKQVTVSYRIDDGRLEVMVCDQGTGFDLGNLRDPLSNENLLKEGGRGVYLMRQFMDEVNFSFPDSGGTCLRLVKTLPAAG